MKCPVCEATSANGADVCPHCGAIQPRTHLSDHFDRLGNRVAQSMDHVLEAALTVPKDVAEELDEMTRAMSQHARSATSHAETVWAGTKRRVAEEVDRSGRAARELSAKGKALPRRVARAGRRAGSKAQRIVRRATRSDPDRASPDAK